jgi:hypothetical protein
MIPREFVVQIAGGYHKFFEEQLVPIGHTADREGG